MKATKHQQPLLRVEGIAAVLDCGEKTVYRLAETGRIPVVRVGGALRFDQDAVIQALSGRPRRRRK